MPSRRLIVLALLVLVAAGVTATAGATRSARPAPAAAPAARAAAPELPPLPKMRPKVVEPAAGVTGVDDAAAPARTLATTSSDESSLPTPKGAATGGLAKDGSAVPSGTGDVHRATALPNGVALPPLEAPEPVMAIIRAGNTIARTPYKWGGGHGRWKDNGYDCSGSVSYALAAGGLIGGPATSGQLEAWGEAGPGRWVTVYASPGHVFMEVAGIRFDTSGAQRTGSRWQNERRPTAGFTVRHPSGL